MIKIVKDYDVPEEEMTWRWHRSNEGKLMRMKACKYVNTSEGCRVGDECVDFHAEMKPWD